MQEQNCRCKLQQSWGRLAQEIRVGRPHTRVFLAKIRPNGPYFGHMAPFSLIFSLTLNMGASCTCKTHVQCKLRQFWGVLRKSPTPRCHHVTTTLRDATARREGATCRAVRRWARIGISRRRTCVTARTRTRGRRRRRCRRGSISETPGAARVGYSTPRSGLGAMTRWRWTFRRAVVMRCRCGWSDASTRRGISRGLGKT
mmetsp:Transcript_2556/g.9268  ORF Transcript_2556/g.9268 Transcript_2556/m.9268 type:complete len:200 (+) Transcript_2556:1815-2414(+)